MFLGEGQGSPELIWFPPSLSPGLMPPPTQISLFQRFCRKARRLGGVYVSVVFEKGVTKLLRSLSCPVFFPESRLGGGRGRWGVATRYTTFQGKRCPVVGTCAVWE